MSQPEGDGGMKNLLVFRGLECYGESNGARRNMG